ncbi:hypothetical protein Hanom_Chr17g01538471 [Helianthus anomalus]
MTEVTSGFIGWELSPQYSSPCSQVWLLGCGQFLLSVHPTILFLPLNPCYYNRTSCRLFIDRPQTFHSHSHSQIYILHTAVETVQFLPMLLAGNLHLQEAQNPYLLNLFSIKRRSTIRVLFSSPPLLLHQENRQTVCRSVQCGLPNFNLNPP